ncbi:FAD-binding domain-containing protein [Basidiobolus meristosporus CBS 931.73]|uniref:FAD-binding domain-containing protein n=1 Tax=Basidiobolus meristosporus CBS 931.73 TaxID=1314790 RepID=A0A1Y1WBX1_9FUNG|nr:FAD-binding domain-containing protein [Basidiobolus meristosporus CBS 931.73]|eukprot:ORX71050.1 FAD-binding domain-containing protein [Basidiobolus meristosporus CBS 931.73]
MKSIKLLYLVVAGVISTSTLVNGDVGSDLLKCLEAAKVETVGPSDPGFVDARYGYDLRYTYKPLAVVYPASNAEVSAAIKCAAAGNVAIAPRSGGHSYEGYSIGGADSSLVIDLKKFSTVSVKNNIATIGGGLRLGQVYYRLFNAGGYAVPGGTCPTVGIGGHSLGGGFGLFSRKYGLMADNIVSADIVLANGTVTTTSASQKSRFSLGGSYGVVTNFKFNVFQPPAKVTTFSYDIKAKDYLKAVKAYNAWSATASRDVGVEMYWDKGGISLYGTYLGPKSKLASVMNTFVSNAPAHTADIKESSFLEAILRWTYLDSTDLKDLDRLPDSKVQDSRYMKGKSLMYKNTLSDEDINIANKWLSKPPTGSTASYIIIDLWGQSKINEVSPNASAFVHRTTTFAIEYITEWGNNAKVYNKPDCKQCLQWMNNFFDEARTAYLKRQSPVEAYQNYIDKDMVDYRTAYYGGNSNIKKLSTVKSAYDPQNVFRFPQSIPVKSPV